MLQSYAYIASAIPLEILPAVSCGNRNLIASRISKCDHRAMICKITHRSAIPHLSLVCFPHDIRRSRPRNLAHVCTVSKPLSIPVRVAAKVSQW